MAASLPDRSAAPIPLASLGYVRRGADELPIAPTPLVGRERVIAALIALLGRADVRLVTLTGPGGAGKTRLALRAATLHAGAFEDGVVFVSLAPIRDPSLVIPTIGRALGLPDLGSGTWLERLSRFLRPLQMLLVLDNFEQVLAAAPDVADLLAASSRTKILATSRSVLRLSGEHALAVPPLALPVSEGSLSLAEAAASEAVQLFLARAQAAKPDFALTPDNAPVVAAICRRLEGLPLAIELAAARTVHLPLAALLQRLERRLPLLTGGPRDLPARQRTMRDAIAWSYDLLSPAEQMLFRRLAVFVGGFTLESAAVVGSDGDLPRDVLDGVAALVEQNVLLLSDVAGGMPPYQMLETVREYGLERLAGSGEEAAVRERHTSHVVGRADQTQVVRWMLDGAMPVPRLGAVSTSLVVSPSSGPDPPGHGLTARELEVLQLVAAGCSNAQIADALFIRVPTVKRHLTNVLGKLGLSSRSAATAYAHRRHLV